MRLGLKRLVVSSLQYDTLKTFVIQLFPAELLTGMAGVVRSTGIVLHRDLAGLV